MTTETSHGPDRRTLLMTMYGLLAVGGLAGTWWFNIQSGAVEGGYLRGWFANAASSSAAVDLLVVFAAAAIFMTLEGRRLGMRWPWVYTMLALPTALAFTFPVFLLLRERQLHRNASKRPVRV